MSHKKTLTEPQQIKEELQEFIEDEQAMIDRTFRCVEEITFYFSIDSPGEETKCGKKAIMLIDNKPYCRDHHPQRQL